MCPGERVTGFAGRGVRAAGWWTALAGRARVLADHWLFSTAVALSLAVRVLATVAFRPALFTPDSFGYLAAGAHPMLGQWHPAGYPALLWALRPFHSLLLVTTAQHLMGVAVAVTLYAVLRRRGLPSWGAVLAASPTLFDSRQIALESFILPDTVYALLLTAAVAVLLTGRRPITRRCAVAGLLVAGAAVTRGNGAPEMVAVLAVLLFPRVGWRAIAAATAAFALPVLAYMGLFAARFGDFALTNSDGMFLWSRTTSFANCSVIKPPANLRPLCPDRQPDPPTAAPAWSLPSLLTARTPASYLWAPGVWWRHDARPGFNRVNNALAMRFALTAIRAQPAGYLRAVTSGVALTFLATDRDLGVRSLHFTPVPDVVSLSRSQVRHLAAYAHVSSNSHPVQPYAYFLYLYQEPVFFPGIAFLLVVAAGLGGVIRWRRDPGGPAALPWAVAVVGIVAPIAVHEYHYRYTISVVPLACLAAGLAFLRRPAPPVAVASPVPPAWELVEAGPAPAGDTGLAVAVGLAAAAAPARPAPPTSPVPAPTSPTDQATGLGAAPAATRPPEPPPA
jgi:hypothetical protein